MKVSTDQLKKLGKKAAATAVGLFAAASLALGAVVDTPDELFSGVPQAAQVVLCASAQDDCAQAAVSSEPAKKERLRDKAPGGKSRNAISDRTARRAFSQIR